MLVDEVQPAVPYRQWVLSFPIPLRLLFAQRSRGTHRAVLAVVTRALTGDVIHRAGQRRCDAETEAEQRYIDVDTAPDDGLVGLADAAVRYRIVVGP